MAAAIYRDRTPQSGCAVFLLETQSVLLNVDILIHARHSSHHRQRSPIRRRSLLPRVASLFVAQSTLVVELGLRSNMW